MIYNKLVRDKIPEIIVESGKNVTFRILDDEEYVKALEKKLDEEVAEFHERKNIEELVDILAVIEALSRAYGGGACELQEFHRQKLRSRGGFELRIFLEEVIEK